jgi:hypothetical protein
VRPGSGSDHGHGPVEFWPWPALADGCAVALQALARPPPPHQLSSALCRSAGSPFLPPSHLSNTEVSRSPSLPSRISL